MKYFYCPEGLLFWSKPKSATCSKKQLTQHGLHHKNIQSIETVKVCIKHASNLEFTCLQVFCHSMRLK